LALTKWQVFAGQLIGKPMTHDKAVQQLQAFSGQKVDFYTGLCLLNSQTGHFQQCVELFSVYFRKLSHEQIERYLHAEQPYFCAGSFKSEGLGICLFEKMQGDDPTSLIGRQRYLHNYQKREIMSSMHLITAAMV
jgi:septum formation protein